MLGLSGIVQPVQVLAVGNAKGGSGKTTAAVGLADALALKGLRVCLLDFDPQGSASLWLGVSSDGAGLVEGLRKGRLDGLAEEGPGFDVIPAGAFLATDGAAYLAGRPAPTVLRSAIKALDYDWLIIDCPPSLGSLVYNALCAATDVLVPCELSILALGGLAQYMELLEAMQDVNPGLRFAGVLPCRLNRTRHARMALEALHEQFPGKVFDPVPELVAVRDAVAMNLALSGYEPASRALETMTLVADKLGKGR